MENKLKIKAFTLSEVLITLGIVGVVAALTIPILAKNIQDYQFKQAAKKAYTQTAQVIQRIKTDNGGSIPGSTFADNNLYSTFMSYFKVFQDCNTHCVALSSSSLVYKSLDKTPAYTWYMAYQFITTDGMFWATSAYDFTITVDVNGYLKGPNIYGRDVFMFQVVNNSLFPMGAPGTTYGISNCDVKNPWYYGGSGCMYYVMQGINYNY